MFAVVFVASLPATSVFDAYMHHLAEHTDSLRADAPVPATCTMDRNPWGYDLREKEIEEAPEHLWDGESWFCYAGYAQEARQRPAPMAVGACRTEGQRYQQRLNIVATWRRAPSPLDEASLVALADMFGQCRLDNGELIALLATKQIAPAKTHLSLRLALLADREHFFDDETRYLKDVLVADPNDIAAKKLLEKSKSRKSDMALSQQELTEIARLQLVAGDATGALETVNEARNAPVYSFCGNAFIDAAKFLDAATAVCLEWLGRYSEAVGYYVRGNDFKRLAELYSAAGQENDLESTIAVYPVVREILDGVDKTKLVAKREAFPYPPIPSLLSLPKNPMSAPAFDPTSRVAAAEIHPFWSEPTLWQRTTWRARRLWRWIASR